LEDNYGTLEVLSGTMQEILGSWRLNSSICQNPNFLSFHLAKTRKKPPVPDLAGTSILTVLERQESIARDTIWG
jgi:hypothetical protein